MSSGDRMQVVLLVSEVHYWQSHFPNPSLWNFHPYLLWLTLPHPHLPACIPHLQCFLSMFVSHVLCYTIQAASSLTVPFLVSWSCDCLSSSSHRYTTIQCRNLHLHTLPFQEMVVSRLPETKKALAFKCLCSTFWSPRARTPLRFGPTTSPVS